MKTICSTLAISQLSQLSQPQSLQKGTATSKEAPKCPNCCAKSRTSLTRILLIPTSSSRLVVCLYTMPASQNHTPCCTKCFLLFSYRANMEWVSPAKTVFTLPHGVVWAVWLRSEISTFLTLVVRNELLSELHPSHLYFHLGFHRWAVEIKKPTSATPKRDDPTSRGMSRYRLPKGWEGKGCHPHLRARVLRQRRRRYQILG